MTVPRGLQLTRLHVSVSQRCLLAAQLSLCWWVRLVFFSWPASTRGLLAAHTARISRLSTSLPAPWRCFKTWSSTWQTVGTLPAAHHARPSAAPIASPSAAPIASPSAAPIASPYAAPIAALIQHPLQHPLQHSNTPVVPSLPSSISTPILTALWNYFCPSIFPPWLMYCKMKLDTLYAQLRGLWHTIQNYVHQISWNKHIEILYRMYNFL